MKCASLHGFISTHRGDIHALCIERTKAYSPNRSGDEFSEGIHDILDEIVGALRQHAGLPARSPLPAKSATAPKFGERRQRDGAELHALAREIGSICDVVCELAGNEGLSFEASEYRTFNLCIDGAIAGALQQFSQQEREQHKAEAAQRIGVIAHELRNALSSARVSFDVLRQGQLGVHSKTGDVVDRSLRRLGILISDMLLAVRLHASANEGAKRTPVRNLLVAVAQSIVSERDIRLLVEVDDTLEAEIDEGVMFAALSNLVQNALKFTRAHGEVKLRARQDALGFVLIEVEDDCGGLPPGDHERPTQPFAPGQRRRGPGSSLAITREAVEMHGGELTIRTLPEHGCVFTMRLRPTASN